jgi:N-formylglutamate amidohydrolase
MCYILKITNLVVFLFSFYLGVAQSYIPGEVYFDSTGFVEYRAGNLPLIFSAPHGGNLEPESIPDRMCDGCVLVNDAWTKPITEGVYDRIVKLTGCYPHVIINLLRRSKFDANRDIEEAATGNEIVEQSWRGYHGFIDAAKTQVREEYKRGLFLDIHGHAHTKQRIELGYLLSGFELRMEDSDLNAELLVAESSIRTLAADNIGLNKHAQLLRGEDSMGTLLEDKGFPAVPSLLDPFPLSSDSYFSGGYNTVRHGSRDNQGAIDAIQIEMNQDIRFDDSTRLVLIDSLAMVALEYYSLHYKGDFQNDFCNLVSATKDKNKEVPLYQIYPNPASDFITVESDVNVFEMRFYNAIGQELLEREMYTGGRIDIGDLESGLYFIQLINEDGLLNTEMMIVE